MLCQAYFSAGGGPDAYTARGVQEQFRLLSPFLAGRPDARAYESIAVQTGIIIFHTDHIKGPDTMRILPAATWGVPQSASTIPLDSSEMTEAENIELICKFCGIASEAGAPLTLKMEAGVDAGNEHTGKLELRGVKFREIGPPDEARGLGRCNRDQAGDSEISRRRPGGVEIERDSVCNARSKGAESEEGAQQKRT